MIPTSTATCCFSKPCATPRRCGALRSKRRMRGKPVIAYKLGRSATARELAVTHTGALAGEDDIADAFLADCGIARVDTLDALIEGLPLLRRVPAVPAGRARRRRRHHHRWWRHHCDRSAGGARHCDRAARHRNAREALGRRHRCQAGAADRSHAHRHALRRDESRARCSHQRAGVRSRALRCRLLGALLSGTRGAPDRRQRGCRQADRGLSDARRPAGPGGADPAGIANFRTPEACADAIAAALRTAGPGGIAASQYHTRPHRERCDGQRHIVPSPLAGEGHGGGSDKF